MTDRDQDLKVSQRISQSYRELGAEEPPRALDDAILAAARRGRQRWYAPLATAAVLVLAVAVTLNLQVERPDIESPVQQAAAPHSYEPAAEPSSPVAPAPAVPASAEPKPFASEQAAASTSARSGESRGAASSVTGTLARQAEERTSRDAEAEAPRPAMRPMPLMERPVELTPEQELERIAGLRRKERHDEADRALAEFRKRYPDYRIAEAMRERVERR